MIFFLIYLRAMLTQRAISANGVPANEIARVLGGLQYVRVCCYNFYCTDAFIFPPSADGNTSKELFQQMVDTALADVEAEYKAGDVDMAVSLYDQLNAKGNTQKDIIDHIDRWAH